METGAHSLLQYELIEGCYGLLLWSCNELYAQIGQFFFKTFLGFYHAADPCSGDNDLRGGVDEVRQVIQGELVTPLTPPGSQDLTVGVDDQIVGKGFAIDDKAPE